MKIEFKNIKHVYFLGIGGIGMSALARYFKTIGKNVAGYDKTSTALTTELINEGIPVHFDDNINSSPSFVTEAVKKEPNSILIIYTPAVPQNHSELVYLKECELSVIKRAEALGLITEQLYTIAVGGTHGKTTVSSLITHILKTAQIDCTAFLGGITQNYNTNFLLSKVINNNTPVVVEADEYDRSFLTLHPNIAVITSADADHLDIYGDSEHVKESYSLFSKKVKPGGKLILKKIVSETLNNKNCITYALNEKADYYASDISIENGSFNYSIICPNKKIEKVSLGLPGMHNIENSIAATAVAMEMNIPENKIKEALASFLGVRRRFDYQIKTEKLIYIDDYAHHPAELKACISSVKQLYPTKKITGIFQPHLFTRTRDFIDEFARSLELLDELYLMEIYPAREAPIPGITSSMLLSKINLASKQVCQKETLVKDVVNKKPEVLLTLGAGDIDTFVEPLKIALSKAVN